MEQHLQSVTQQAEVAISQSTAAEANSKSHVAAALATDSQRLQGEIRMAQSRVEEITGEAKR